MIPAVFLDRDGVLNALVYNPQTSRYESPHFTRDFMLLPEVLPALQKLTAAGFALFVVSNQPSYALGKTSLEEIHAIQVLLVNALEEAGLSLVEAYYCYHHPQGVVAEYSGPCVCRKPSPYFFRKAERDHQVDLSASWLIGDQDRDIQAGQAAGVKTILLNYPLSASQRGSSQPEYTAGDLPQAVEKILEAVQKG